MTAMVLRRRFFFPRSHAFAPQCAQFGEALVEPSIVGDLKAKHQREPAVLAFGGSFVLKPLGALRKPDMFGKAIDEQEFRCGLRRVLGAQGVTEFVKYLL